MGGVLFGVLKPWLAHQVLSVVAATPVANSTPSDHDSPNAPATARSVYVIAHLAVRHPPHAPWSGVTAPSPQASDWGPRITDPAPWALGMGR